MKTTAQHLSGAQLRERVLDLRVKGLTYRKIGRIVGRSYQRVAKICAQELDRVRAKNLETMQHNVDLEIRRLDALLLTHWHRRRNPENSQVIMRIMERRAKLLGLDKPTQTELGGFNGTPLIPPSIDIGFKNGGPGKPSTGSEGS